MCCASIFKHVLCQSMKCRRGHPPPVAPLLSGPLFFLAQLKIPVQCLKYQSAESDPLSVSLSIYLSIYLSIKLYIYLPISSRSPFISFYLSLQFYPSKWLTIYLPRGLYLSSMWTRHCLTIFLSLGLPDSREGLYIYIQLLLLLLSTCFTFYTYICVLRSGRARGTHRHTHTHHTHTQAQSWSWELCRIQSKGVCGGVREWL